jgi:hypothetical protein
LLDTLLVSYQRSWEIVLVINLLLQPLTTHFLLIMLGVRGGGGIWMSENWSFAF